MADEQQPNSEPAAVDSNGLSQESSSSSSSSTETASSSSSEKGKEQGNIWQRYAARVGMGNAIAITIGASALALVVLYKIYAYLQQRRLKKNCTKSTSSTLCMDNEIEISNISHLRKEIDPAAEFGIDMFIVPTATAPASTDELIRHGFGQHVDLCEVDFYGYGDLIDADTEDPVTTVSKGYLVVNIYRQKSPTSELKRKKTIRIPVKLTADSVAGRFYFKKEKKLSIHVPKKGAICMNMLYETDTTTTNSIASNMQIYGSYKWYH